MSDAYDAGTEGERWLAAYLRDRGCVVKQSDKKMFDLIVDGRYAEVKSSNGPYSKLGFICLTENQYKALANREEFSVFIICNLKNPKSIEVVEILAAQLRTEKPKVEPKYYWYRSQLERCRIIKGTN